jgi:hypothetical protein
MKNTTHIMYTWLLSHLLHFVVWFFIANGFGMAIAFPLCLMAFFVSIPAILAYRFCHRVIIQSSYSPAWKFIIWLFSAPFITALCAFVFILLMLNGDVGELFHEEMLFFALPSVIATFFAVFIRYSQFYRFNAEYPDSLESAEPSINEDTIEKAT